MTANGDARAYEAVHDPAELRIAVRELRRVRAWLDQFADIAAEMPGFDLPDVAAAKRMTKAVVSVLLARAEARLRGLSLRSRPAEVLVVDAARRRPVDHAAGFSFVPMVSEPTVAVEGLSTGVLRLEVGQAGALQVYPDADVVFVVLFGAVDIVWWDAAGEIRPVVVRRHQHAYVRRGTRHSLANTGAVPALAVQVRAVADATAGVELVAELAADSAVPPVDVARAIRARSCTDGEGIPA